MEGIYFKEGVYIHVEDTEGQDDCLFNYKIDEIRLFGGRVQLKQSGTSYIILKVDGFAIIELDYEIWRGYRNDLSFSTVIAHLNAMESNGVDSFLQHYRQNIEYVYGELKTLSEQTSNILSYSHEDAKTKDLLKQLDNIRNLLLIILSTLFNLRLLMPTGLENEKVVTIYQSIIDSMA